MVSRSPRLLSIPTKVFIGIAGVILAFGAVVVFSLTSHQRTNRSLKVINQVYLPLMLSMAEAQATQVIFNTLLDRLFEERDPTVTRNWIGAARRVRPVILRSLGKDLRQAEALDLNLEEKDLLKRAQKQISFMLRSYKDNEPLYEELFSSLSDGRNMHHSRKLLEDLKRKERKNEKVLRSLRNELTVRMTTLADEMEQDEFNALVSLAAAFGIALMIGFGVALGVHRTLKPLARLHAGVRSVARGDLSKRVDVERDDEIGSLARDFNRMADALVDRERRMVRSERLAAVGELAAHVTHEIRNPLSSMGLNVEMLEEEMSSMKGTSGEAAGLIKAVHSEIDRLSGITEDYLNLARLPEPVLEDTDLNAVVRSVVEFFRPQLAENEVKVDLVLDEGLLPVPVDEGQMRQAMGNLLKNAMEAMPDGGTICVNTHKNDEGVFLGVTDDGPGVTDEIRGRIFDSFFSTKESGTGLGLPLTRQIINAHGGRIEYRDGDTGGTVFEIFIPFHGSKIREA